MQSERARLPASGQHEQRAERVAPTPVVQAKLRVGATSDPAERAADAAADEVVGRLKSAGGSTPRNAPAKLDAGSGTDPVERAASDVIVRMRSTVGSDGGELDPDTADRIERSRGRGSALDAPLRRSMETAFGADFSNVKMHVDADSDALNDRIQARAFTTGSDVFVRRADYAPGTQSGQHLIAHELAHTVQQGATGVRRRTNTLVQRETKKMTAEQQAQYLDLGDMAQYAARNNPLTDYTEGKPSEAFAVLPREADGSLTPAAMAIIEKADREGFDRTNDKWMLNTIPAPARKQWLFIMEQDKAYQKRVGAAAKQLNPLTGRSTVPELANLTQSNGQKDEVVERPMKVGSANVTVRYNSSDFNQAERRGMIRAALEKATAAGASIGAGLVFQLPKYGRKFQVNGAGELHPEVGTGTRAIFVTPGLIHLSSEIMGNPLTKTDTDPATGEERPNYLSASIDPSGVASIVHEIGHYCHYHHNPSKFHLLSGALWASGSGAFDAAKEVSGYATEKPRELVAETFLGLVYGRTFSDKVLDMYLTLGGMPIGAALARVAKPAAKQPVEAALEPDHGADGDKPTKVSGPASTAPVDATTK